MNIGIVTTWFERGASYVSRQYMEVLQKEHSVFIYARSGEAYAKGDPKWDLPNVYWSKKINSPFVVTVIDKREFVKWLKVNNIDLVIFNEQHWWEPLLWCYELKITTVAYIDYYTENTIPLFGIYDMLICNTKKHFDAFKWHPGAKYIPWGTNIEIFKPNPDTETNKEITFFHSCGFAPKRKGTDLLLRAMDHMKSSNYKVVVHTQVNLRDSFPELTDKINMLIKDQKLQIIENTFGAPGLYYLGNIYVYPSRLEGIGLTIAEAISTGLGIIVPDHGPMNEFVESNFGKTVKISKVFSRSDGYYWPQNEVDVVSLAQAMDEFVLIKEKIPLIKLAARAYAESFLDWKKNSLELLNIIVNDFPDSINVKTSTINKIIQFESMGLRKYNKAFLHLQWLFKLYKR